MTPAGNAHISVPGSGVRLEGGPWALRAMVRGRVASASSPGLSLYLSFLIGGHGAELCAVKEKKKDGCKVR